MKKLTLTLLAVAFMSASAFAELPKAPPPTFDQLRKAYLGSGGAGGEWQAGCTTGNVIIKTDIGAYVKCGTGS